TIEKMISYSDIIIVNTDFCYNFISSRFPNAHKKIKKIYNRSNIIYNPGINVNRDEVRKRLKVTENTILIIFLGFINKEKSLESLFRALRLIYDQSRKAKLLIIGEPGGFEKNEAVTKYYEDLKKLSHALDLDNDVFWAGYCSSQDVSMSLLSSDLAVLPFYDGISGKRSSFWSVLEHGLTTITTFSPEENIPEGLENNKNVILVPAGDADELKDAIIKCMDEPALCKHIGENGRKLVIEKYSWENLIRELVDIYKE
ncbi:MAG: glycosyltransferase family 4 protein, partial [Candidatus Firestonebacteria bacterium]|nr:glycosyltransferase family 4 protein [Candidatus Firestonebacteria bacterium]